jgi:rRNA maturation endonuclease Nob1
MRKDDEVIHMVVCRRCLRKYVVDWTVLGTASGVCELCGAAADFEVDFATIRLGKSLRRMEK